MGDYNDVVLALIEVKRNTDKQLRVLGGVMVVNLNGFYFLCAFHSRPEAESVSCRGERVEFEGEVCQ